MDARETVARAYGVCATTGTATNPRILALMNEAQERLLNRPGKPVGSTVRYRFRTNDSAIVLPRQIRTVERISICNRPGTHLPEWYEFLFNAPGQLTDETSIGDKVVDHGTDCKFDAITCGETDRTIQVTTDLNEDAETYIWLYGYDENGNWIRTNVGGEWVDGERIDLSTCPVTTTNFFTSLVRVKKDVTDGVVRLYEWDDTGGAVVKALAMYEPSETDPIYRRLFIPDLANMGTCPDEDDCEDKAVTVYARLQHIPVSGENDAFIVGNLAALKLMTLAIKHEERENLQEAMAFQGMAERELEGELAAYIGDGQRIGLSFEDSATFGGGEIENPI